MALTEVGLDDVGGVLAEGAVEEGEADTLDAVEGATVEALDWDEKGGQGVTRGNTGTRGDSRGPAMTQMYLEGRW